MHEALYPTVGVDSNKPLSVNFGEEPFIFDTRRLGGGRSEVIERLGLKSRAKQMKRIKRRRSRAKTI